MTLTERLTAVAAHSPPLYRGEWMQVSGGRRFFIMDPQPSEIHIADIAASLSKLCRYGGHTKRFYSVAEHCVHIANAAPVEHALTALLHDASEAYLVDVPRPVKRYLSNYAKLESDVMRAVAERFGIAWPLPEVVKRLDNAILADERAQVMPRMLEDVPNHDWGATEPALGVEIGCWSPDKAEYEFLAAFDRFGGR